MAVSKSSTAAKARKATGTSSASGNFSAAPEREAVPATVKPEMRQSDKASAGTLKKLLYNVYCLAGGPIWNPAEVVVVYILLISLAALTAMGTCKQLAKLAVELLAA
ncbi:hypothetical protein GPECTOR_91g555 [Gonium pectorale]|uniref:Uncharacterized protein n=1 Tax=Gonium pectorale TaxID=33097 RepID=A0A150G0P5_GONPE|nr:hypothetical protein GPECTOR_91g555 [Gonium pectorale]|eukprot:KXZ43401.1 hypothetical protein GPECTOR_91g555 [Gonium pectorale]